MSVEFGVNNTIGWTSVTLSENNILLSIVIIGILLHSSLWFQLFFHKISFNLSFIFSLGYVLTDVLLICSYLVQYGIRSHELTSTSRVSCYFQAYFMFYFNILESVCLTCLNVARYCQIVRNRNVYSLYPHQIILISIIIPLLILINMIIQQNFGWCVVIEKAGLSCSLGYTNIAVRVWNIIFMFFLPIMISFCTSIRCVFFVKETQNQQVIIRRNHHRRLIYRFIIFYTIWLILWGPFMLVTHLDIETVNDQINLAVKICSTIEMSIDGILVYFLDKRFEMAWKKSYFLIIRKLGLEKNARVHPRIEFPLTTNIKTVSP